MDNLEEEFQVKRHEVFKHQEMRKSNEQQVKECLRADKKGEVGWTGGKKSYGISQKENFEVTFKSCFQYSLFLIISKSWWKRNINFLIGRE